MAATITIGISGTSFVGNWTKNSGNRPAAGDPLFIDTDVLFYLGDEVFTTVGDYQRFYETVPTYNPDGYKIALITTVPGPFNANRDHLNAMIDAFEAGRDACISDQRQGGAACPWSPKSIRMRWS